MHRTIAGLTALLVSYAVLSTGDAEAGRRRRAACCYQPPPCRNFSCTCLQSVMFSMGPSMNTYAAYCYSNASNCADGTLCSWDGSYLGELPQPCNNTSGCAPIADSKTRRPGILGKKVIFNGDKDEDSNLGNKPGEPRAFTIVERTWTYDTNVLKQAPNAVVTTDPLVILRLIKIKWNTRTNNFPQTNPPTPPYFWVGYEIDPAQSKGVPDIKSMEGPTSMDGLTSIIVGGHQFNNTPDSPIRAILYESQPYFVRLCLACPN